MKNPVKCGIAALIVFPLALCAADAPKDAERVKSTRAREAFEKLKSHLTGDWVGKSTKGWTEKITYRAIAGGSVLMEVSYGAHEGEWMATMYHMDGDKLMLTHYCVAKNQPRLVATDISEDLTKLTFTFLDGTNLPTRDKGHMDKHVLRLTDKDHFFSRWTWYQDGKESWMEDIEHRRAKESDKESSKPSGK